MLVSQKILDFIKNICKNYAKLSHSGHVENVGENIIFHFHGCSSVYEGKSIELIINTESPK